MSVAAIHPTPSAMTPTGEQSPRPPLRRATYVHISDLTSAYNIDHRKLEQELARVKNTDEDDESELSPEDSGADGDVSLASGPQHSKRLQPPRGGFNLCLLVGDVNVVVDKLRVDGSRVRLAEVVVGDETGCVSLRARDDQIEELKEMSGRSGSVVLRNCTLELYQGKHIRLAVTKWGKLNPYPDHVASTPPPPSKMNADRNFSLIDLSLVASEMVDTENIGAPNQRDSAPETYGSSNRSGPMRYQYQQGSYGQGRRQAPPRRQQRQYKPSYAHIGHHMGQIGYQQMPYPYGQPPQHAHQEGPNQHLLLRQHYELQQQQLRQMQAYHGSQDQRRPLGPPSIAGSTSFETTGEYSLGSIGGNPMFVPVSIQGARSSSSPMLSPGPSQPEHFAGAMSPTYGLADAAKGQPSTQQTQGGMLYQPIVGHHAAEGRFFAEEPDRSTNEAWSGQLSPAGPAVLSPRSESPISVSPSHMNASALAFDPSFMNQPQQHGYGYVRYDPSQGAPPMYHASTQYSPTTMYVATAHPGEYSSEQVPDSSQLKQAPDAAHEDDGKEHTS